jgi:hypothetical protein
VIAALLSSDAAYFRRHTQADLRLAFGRGAAAARTGLDLEANPYHRRTHASAWAAGHHHQTGRRPHVRVRA